MADNECHGKFLRSSWGGAKNSYSSGHKKHEYTTGSALNIIMDFFAISHLLPK